MSISDERIEYESEALKTMIASCGPKASFALDVIQSLTKSNHELLATLVLALVAQSVTTRMPDTSAEKGLEDLISLVTSLYQRMEAEKKNASH